MGTTDLREPGTSALTSRDAVTLTCTGQIGVATISRPDSRNALSSEVLNGLIAACSRAVADSLLALVITAEGHTFCSGGDLASVVDCLDGDIDRDLGRMVDELHAAVTAIRAMPMPVVVAVNGPAVGAGISLAMAGDVRVIARSAFFLTGYLGVGASPDGGASYHLARALGESQALASFLLNRKIPAEQLLDRGLVEEIVADTEVCEAGLRLAGKLADISFTAVQATRQLVSSASAHTLAEHLDAEKQQFLAIAKTQEFRQGVAPFARRPTNAGS